ncbi:MAG: c-type cytochrome [Pirellulaceae bacterium]|nr:c-type cytochrome [Pirellulaceae bacterium]
MSQQKHRRSRISQAKPAGRALKILDSLKTVGAWWLVLSLVSFSGTVSKPVHGQDPFSEGVRTTEPLAPVDQLQTFQVPADLAVDLIAAEPIIQKPLNIAFDVYGRLWVSCTIEYPYPAKDGQGRDRIVVLEDTDRDGSFDKHTVFADNLNIPIGILPLGDDCLVFDIPYIHRLRDTDGDGKCDSRERLLGPFDCTRDTHGMNNSFIQGFDGWIYACHGFANRSVVSGSDGHQVTLNSGNVYRFRLDGSRIEHIAHGQVNPYGMACDEWFSLFTADCHSKPLTQVLRGAYFPSFGAPHDGLGFAPSMMEHFHGSTAIAGVEVLAAANFPLDYAGQIVSGNVMTSRINRNRIDWRGAYAQAIELPDLLATSDPWFRPVNLIQGPDGGVYIADFYNRIIGHYEVPLEHPGRDRDRGRIWRLRSAKVEPPQLAQTAATLSRDGTLAEFWQMLDHPSPRTRMSGLNELVAHVESRKLHRDLVVRWLVSAFDNQASDHVRVASLWGLLRIAPQSVLDVFEPIQRHGAPVVRGHLQRVLAEAVPQGAFNSAAQATFEQRGWNLPLGRGPELSVTPDVFINLIQSGLRNEHPRVVQAAIDAAGRLGEVALLGDLVQLASNENERDPVVVHSARIALKRMLGGSGVLAEDQAWANHDKSQAEIWDSLRKDPSAIQHQATLASVMLAIQNSKSADFLLDYLAHGHANPQAVAMIQHIARYLPSNRANELVQLIRTNFAGDITAQWALLQAVGEGLVRSGQTPPDSVLQWSSELVQTSVEQLISQPEFWLSYQLDRRTIPPTPEDAWQIQVRPIQSRESQPNAKMFSSLPNGESRTGVLRSPRFEIPESLRFAMAGHRGFPDQPAHDRNQVRLHLSNGSVVKVAFPPRNDVAQWTEWDLRMWAGQTGYLEIQDGDSAGAYAWLAVGQFEPPVVTAAEHVSTQISSVIQSLCQTATQYRLTEAIPALLRLFDRHGLHANDRLLLAQTIADLRGQGFGRALAGELIREELSDETKVDIARMIGKWQPSFLATPAATAPNQNAQAQTPTTSFLLLDLIARLSGRQQKLLVRAAANEAEVFEKTLEWAEDGRVAADCFSDPNLLQQIKLADRGDWGTRIEALLKNVPAPDEAWRQRAINAPQKLKPWLDELTAAGSVTATQVELDSELVRATIRRGDLAEWKQVGQQIFKRDCAACHQLHGEGAVVGPQLDGINRRGLERVLEDVLLPNQNVDHAFRSQVLLLASGQLIVGLIQAEDETSLQMTDQQGKAVTVPVAQIEERRTTPQSLMPGDVAHQYSDATLLGLMSFLLEQSK